MLKENINPFLFIAGLLVGLGFMFFLSKLMNRPCVEEAEQFKLRTELLETQMNTMETQIRFQDSVIHRFQELLLDTAVQRRWFSDSQSCLPQ